jgi:hypothetical protein
MNKSAYKFIMDHIKLIEFFKTNPYAAKLIFALCEEYKPGRETSVSSAVSILEANEISVTYSQVVALFRQLEKIECGIFFVGRKGKRSRLYWKEDVKAIGKLLEDNHSTTEPSPKAPVKQSGGLPVRTDAILRHTFHLRQDFELVLNLPSDLTEKDAQRISKFVESLPL